MDLDVSEQPKPSFVWRELAQIIVFMLSLTAIVVAMVGGSSPAYAGFIGVAFAVVLGFAIKPGLLTDLSSWVRFIRSAGLISAQLVVIVGAVGIIIGILNLTGVGLRFASLVASYADGQLAISLLLMAVACLLLGMGMPTTAAYAVAASVVAPGLVDLGIPLLTAHFFVFYFAVVSAITPPVALASFAAAGISGANPLQTSLASFKIGIAAFVVPFMFFYNSTLLMEGEWLHVLRSGFTAVFGIFLLACAVQGWFVGNRARFIVRLTLAVAAFLMISGGLITDLVGLGVAGAVFILQKVVKPGSVVARA
jgi:TRAP-type uncharacterized transport system fused permease subunit